MPPHATIDLADGTIGSSTVAFVLLEFLPVLFIKKVQRKGRHSITPCIRRQAERAWLTFVTTMAELRRPVDMFWL